MVVSAAKFLKDTFLKPNITEKLFTRLNFAMKNVACLAARKVWKEFGRSKIDARAQILEYEKVEIETSTKTLKCFSKMYFIFEFDRSNFHTQFFALLIYSTVHAIRTYVRYVNEQIKLRIDCSEYLI